MTINNKVNLSFKFLCCMISIIFFLNLQSFSWAESGSVVISVNGNPITNFDIEHRIALLKLQNREGNLKKIAEQELIDEKLKRLEAARLHIRVSKEEAKKAYTSFAAQNQMPADEFSMLLNNIGVTSQHFEEYIRTQMEWGKVIGARYQSESSEKGAMISETDAIQKLIHSHGKKPSVKEYDLRQITLLLPYKERAKSLFSLREDAKKIKSRFLNCATIERSVKGTLNASVQNIGRILEPQLPSEWEKEILKTPIGHLTNPIATNNGLILLAVCKVRRISNDRVAQLVFSIDNAKQNNLKDIAQLDEKYIKELREHARVQYFK